LNNKPEKVLVLGHGVSAFLSVIRSLGRKGVEVHVAWCRPDSVVLYSRYVRRYHRLPFFDAEGRWPQALAELLERERYDLVLPTNEQSIRALALHRRQFEQHARLCLPDEATFDIVFDKIKSCQLAADLGLRVPRTRVISNAAELDDLAAQFAYPIVVKPISSYNSQSPTERLHVAKACNRSELDQHVRRMLDYGPCSIQENFVGQGAGVEMLVDSGKVLLAFQHQRVHEPMRGGTSTYRKSVFLRPDLLAAATRLVEAMNYSGVVMAEFLVSRTDGDWRFVEVNGRFWGSLPLAIAAGADFPYALCRFMLHGQREFPAQYRANIFCRDLIGDVLWFGQNLRADRSDPTLTRVPIYRVLGEIKNVLLGREHFDSMTLDDPLPGLAEPLHYLRKIAHRVAVRAKQAITALPPSRRRIHSHAAQKLARAELVVFLCWGNICRSPFAAAYAESLWPARVKVLSRGLVHPGRRSPAEARKAAQKHGVCLEDHRAEVISKDDITSADLIVCFDEPIRQEFRQQHPAARAKIVSFGALAADGPLDVDDPFGCGLPVFDDTYEQIKRVIDSSAALLGNMNTQAASAPQGEQAAAT
jgi:protein-tyrosine-phosphatase/predicted ATP-grasp superfamily ATP-dependent carboligase